MSAISWPGSCLCRWQTEDVSGLAVSGIVGIVNLDGAPVDRGLLDRMTASMAVRGPDARQVWAGGSVGFGHAMLRTTSESEEERQPWTLKEDEKIDILSGFAEALRHISLLLLQFIPETAQKISKQMNVPYAHKMLLKDFAITKQMKTWGGIKEWTKVGEPSILFAPIE